MNSGDIEGVGHKCELVEFELGFSSAACTTRRAMTSPYIICTLESGKKNGRENVGWWGD